MGSPGTVVRRTDGRAARGWHDVPVKNASTDGPLVLGIETSCDETGVGIVRGHTLLADAVASSVEEHARFGGVVPEVASRAHLEAMVPTIRRACETAGIVPGDVDAVAVTAGPGLAGALLVGVAAPAKALALALEKPLYGVNHLASHVAVDSSSTVRCPSAWSPAAAPAQGRGHHRRRGAAPADRRRGGRGVRKGRRTAARLFRLPQAGITSSPRGQRRGDRLPASAARGAAPLRLSSPASRPPSPAGSRCRERLGEPVPVADVAASFQEAVCDVLTRRSTAPTC